MLRHAFVAAVLLALVWGLALPVLREPAPPDALVPTPVTRSATITRIATTGTTSPRQAPAVGTLAASGRHGWPAVLAHATRPGVRRAARPTWHDVAARVVPPGDALGRLRDAPHLRLRAARPAMEDTLADTVRDRSLPWAADRLLADPTHMNDEHLALAANPATGHLFAVWEAYDLGGTDRDIHIARSTDGGQVWQTWEMPSFSLDEAMPDLAVDASGYLHVVWVRDDGVILRARSAGPEDCQNWSWVQGFTVGEPVYTPSIAVSGGGDFAKVFIACTWVTINYDWYQYEGTLLWLYSTNGGATVSYNYLQPDGFEDLWPDVAFTGTRVIMLNGEADPYSGRVRILAAGDAMSGTFGDFVDLSATTPMSCGFPGVACDGDGVYMTYQLDWDDGLGNVDGDIMYAFSWDGLATVYGPYEMMATTSESVGPAIYARDGMVGCLWLEAPPGGDEFDLAARQAGSDGHPDAWGDMEIVTDQPRVEPRFRSVAGAVGPLGLNAAWVDRRDFPTQGLNIYASDRGLAADLGPFAPDGWASPLVISMVPGAREDGIVAAGQTAYVSFGLANLGLADATATVQAQLRIDGDVVGTWQIDGGLAVSTYATVEDWSVVLPSGAHTLTLWIDPADLVPESDETDNLLDKDIWVMTGAAQLTLSPTQLRFDVTREPPCPLLLRDAPARADRVESRLAAAVARAVPGAALRVVITPATRVDIPALVASLQALPPATRREEAVGALQLRADAFAATLVARAGGGRGTADLHNWRPLWLSGEVCVTATPAGVAQLASWSEVGALWLDDQLSQPFFTPGPRSDEPTRTRWFQSLVGADAAWAQGFDGTGILVGHTDSGCAYDHPDLAGHLWDGGTAYPHHGWDCLDEDDDPYDGDTQYWHGTHTAGLVVGSLTGTAPGARLVVTRCVPGYYDDLVEALQFCLDHGCRLITTSAGWTQPGAALKAANRANAEVLLALGIPWFVAAGNGDNQGGHVAIPEDISSPGDGPEPWFGDAGHAAVLAVGAVTQARVVWSSSSRGPTAWGANDQDYADYPYPPGLGKPDLAAPGASITSTIGGGGYATYSGTSMATPLAAGCAAILLQANPYLTPAEVAQALETTASDLGTSGRDNDTGAGLIQVATALTMLPDCDAQAVTVTNRGNIPLIIDTISWSAPWLVLGPTSGVVQPGDSLRVVASVDAAGLEDGLHATNVRLFSNDPASPADLPVTLAFGNVVGVSDTATAMTRAAITCRPNPFNPRTTVNFAMVRAGTARLAVYDLRGRRVRVLVHGEVADGLHSVEWDGCDAEGRACASGVYVMRLESAQAVLAVGKAVLVR